MAEDNVVYLRVAEDRREKSCFICKHASFGDRGTYCHEWGELIFSERLEAADCNLYEEDPDGR